MGVATAAIVGSAVVAAGSSYLASQEAKKGAAAQQAAAEAALRTFQGVPIPSVEEQKIILQNPDLMGQYTPEQVQAMQLMSSGMENVHADQATVDAQNEALQGIGEVAKGGYTEADKSTARQIQETVSQDAQARKKAILDSMAQRGMLGSGMELAAQLQSDQQSAEQMSKGGEGLTQQAQARALQALGQQGTLSANMRSQQFNEGTAKAQAQDAINQFNVNNAQNIANQNVGQRNQAQLLNLNQKQNLENQRAALANQQHMYNKQLLQTQFANRTGQANQIAGAQQTVGAAQNAASQAQAGMIQGIGGALSNAVGGYGGMVNDNEQADKNRANALAVANAKK
jgi:hypothetical protein